MLPLIRKDLFADDGDFSWANMIKGRNAFFQKQMADQVQRRVDEATSLLTDALSIHLNVGQTFIMNTSSTFLTLGKVSTESLLERVQSRVAGGQVFLPSTLFSNQTSNNSPVFARVRRSLRRNRCHYLSCSRQS